jgi:Glycosyltransferase family 87
VRSRWPLLLAFAAAAALVYHASGRGFWSDFGVEAYPSYKALQQGDLHLFAERLPAYGGYLIVVGAPWALLSGWLGGIEELTLGLTAIPAGVALALLLNALAQRLRASGARPLAVLLAIGIPLPLAKLALEYGHPEDVLAAAACVGAVLAARRDRTTIASALLALAIVSKQWAVLAVLPAALAAPRRQLRLGASALGAAGAVLIPIMLVAPHAQHALVTTAAQFHSQQIFWPLGVPVPPGVKAPIGSHHVAPAWLSAISHPLIVALALPLSALWWRRGRRREDAFALLALLFLGRCALDPWNIHYYHLPLVLSLLAWEVELERPLPVISLATVAAVWGSFFLPGPLYGDGLFALYMGWTLPLAAHLIRSLYFAPLPSVRPWHAGPISAAPQSSPSISTT